jgi:hypothetical protein
MVAIDRIGDGLIAGFGDQMQSYLMAEKVQVDPALIGSAFVAPEYAAVKRVRRIKVRHWNCEMKRTQLTATHLEISPSQSLGRR